MSDDAYAYVVVRLPAEKRRALVERADELGAEVVAQWRVAKPPRPSCCGGTGLADYAAVPCPAPDCPVRP